MLGNRNQIALLHILGAGNDLYRRFFAYIDLAYPHMVGILVTDDVQNLAYYNIFDLGIQPLVGFYLLTGYGHYFHKFLIGDMAQVYKFLMEPFSVQFHLKYLLRTGSGTGHRYQRSDADR